MSFCADDAANQAAREVMVQMADDADVREKRLADHLNGVLKR